MDDRQFMQIEDSLTNVAETANDLIGAVNAFRSLLEDLPKTPTSNHLKMHTEVLRHMLTRFFEDVEGVQPGSLQRLEGVASSYLSGGIENTDDLPTPSGNGLLYVTDPNTGMDTVYAVKLDKI